MTASDFQWYHRIDLGNGEITQPLSPYDDTWELIRSVRRHIPYDGRRVLDIAAFDGMWTFEAEALGASQVVAVDVPSRLSAPYIAQSLDKFLYAKSKLGSRAIPYFDRSIHSLDQLLAITGTFHIIQNLGLLYHLENPWHALKQCRKVMATGGVMLIETAFDPDLSGCSMRMNRGSDPFYPTDPTSYWAPSKECLIEMLRSCLFEPIEGTTQSIRQRYIGRIAMAVRPVSGNDQQDSEFYNDYRTSI